MSYAALAAAVMLVGGWAGAQTFAYRRPITLNYSQRGTNCGASPALASFPVLIDISAPWLRTVAADPTNGRIRNANGYDIVFRTSSGRTHLEHEIEFYDGSAGAGRLIAWVNVPSLFGTAGNDTIYVYYGNASVTTSSQTTATWNSGYAAVWHLKESGNGTAGEFKDSTSNANHGQGRGGTGVPTRTTGRIGYGEQFTRAYTQWIEVPDNANGSLRITGTITLEAWINSSTWQQFDYSSVVARQYTANGGPTPWYDSYQLGPEASGGVSSTPYAWMTSGSVGGGTVNTGTWYHLAATVNGTSSYMYVDGARPGTAGSLTISITNGNPVTIGGQYNGGATPSQIWDGIIDEVRISNVVRSQCWIETEYSNMNAPGSFITVGSEGAAGPTAVDLASFGATSHPGQGVLVSWQTGWEVDNLGFHVYREVGGERVRVTPDLIAGSALVAGAGTELGAGRSYGWWDSGFSGGVAPVYWLEEWQLDGTRRWHGPVDVEPALPGEAVPAVRRSVRLSGLGASEPGLVRAGPVVESGGLDQGSGLTASSAAGVLSAGVGGTADGVSRLVPRRRFEQVGERQWAVAGQSVVKLGVTRPGWYRVSRDELVGAGLDPSIDPRTLQLYADGEEVPIRVVGEEDGVFGSSDGLEWYGRGVDTPSTDTRVYYLVAGRAWGERIEAVPGGGGEGSGGPVSFPYEVVREDESIYFAALKNGAADNFFGPIVAGEAVSQALSVHHLDRSCEVSLGVRLQGASPGWHRVGVSVSGMSVGEIEWGGQGVGEGTFAVPAGLVRMPATTVRFEPLGGEGDVSLIERVFLRYAHTYQADSWALTGTVPGGTGITLGGFWPGPVRVVDITEPDRPVELVGPYAGSSFKLTVPGSGTRTVVASSADWMAKPAWVRANRPSALWAAEGADLLIVGPGEFLPAVVPLMQLRQSEGLKVLAVDIEDVVDEFGAGAWGPGPLQALLRHATGEWHRPPRYVLLVGDATLDPRDYLGYGDQDFVPTVLVETEYFEAASDAALADTDGDGLADLAIGRLPVGSLAEAQAVVAKIVAYERQASGGPIVLVADANDEENDFEEASRRVFGAVPRTQPVKMFQRGYLGSEKTRALLYEELQRGPMLVNYLGHGSVAQWAGQLLSVDGVRWLSSNRLAVVLAMTCLNAYFLDPMQDSLGEALLESNGGAAAVWASTGLTELAPQLEVNLALVQGWFAGGTSPRLGDLIVAATAATGDRDVRATWVLLGDPTMRVH